MANLILPQPLTMADTLRQMGKDAAFDVGEGDFLTHNEIADLDNIRAAAPPPKVPKVFLSNDCSFNCSYCGCRAGRCAKRYAMSPRDLAAASVAQARQNGHGIFITSAIYKNADYTEELIVKTLEMIRFELGYTGFVHAKIMPGADPLLVERAGWLADRLSINIELPKSEGYAVIAKQKNKTNILKPMGEISRRIAGHAGEKNKFGRPFAKAGQTTQMIVGSMGESDRTVLTLSEAIYRKYRLRRVYYSPFSNPGERFNFFPENDAPTWRTRRLYQADRLMQLYGFTADELAPAGGPGMQMDIDPKAAWALANLHQFPVEVNTADFETLIRVPGIGAASAKKIMYLRKSHALTHDLLRQARISLKRAVYFITCSGKYAGQKLLESPFLRAKLSDTDMQLSIFNDRGRVNDFSKMA